MEKWTPELEYRGINPPTIIGLDDNYHIVVFGGNWYKAPKNVTLDMVQMQWHRWRPKGWVDNSQPIYHKVLSSKGDTWYTVTVYNGSVTCSCPAGTYRGACKHISSIKQQ